MTPLVATLALAAAVALLMLANTNRARCRMRGHAWGRAYTDDKRRLERCDRCFTVRDHVFVVPTAATVDALTIDGTAPVSFVVSPRAVAPEPVEVVDEVAARRAEIAATVRAKYGAVSAESKGVS